MSNLSKACCIRQESGEYPCFALMSYRDTPLGHNLPSPLELLCATQARSDLPTSHAARMQIKQATTKQPVIIPQSDTINSNKQELSTGYWQSSTNSYSYDIQDTTKQVLVSCCNHKYLAR